MYAFLIVVHLVICFLMVGVILLQSGKGAEIGAAFGGASQTIFGSRGPGTFLSKVTVGAAVIFMLTSLGLAILSKERSLFSITDGQAESPIPVSSSPEPGEQVSAEPEPQSSTPFEAEATTPAKEPQQ